ncbi:MAG: hypothetical protein ACPG21_13960 [Crocinitomicaceae bacterium]
MKYWSIIGLFAIGIMFSCGNSKEVMTDEVLAEFKLNDTTNIEIGQMMICSEDLKLFVQFDSVLTDSRCPRGANCIWEGDAAVQFSVTYKRAMDTISLHTNQEGEKVQSLFGYNFEFINLSPYPGDKDYDTATKTAQIVVTEAD